MLELGLHEIPYRAVEARKGPVGIEPAPDDIGGLRPLRLLRRRCSRTAVRAFTPAIICSILLGEMENLVSHRKPEVMNFLMADN